MYILGMDPSQVWAAAEVPGFATGTLGANDLGQIFEFAQSDASTTLTPGDVMTLNQRLGTMQRAATSNTDPGDGQGKAVGIACGAIEADGWGWVQRAGYSYTDVAVLTGCAKGTVLNSTATTGSLDDDATAGSEVIEGLTTTEAESGGFAQGVLHWPYVGRTL